MAKSYASRYLRVTLGSDCSSCATSMDVRKFRINKWWVATALGRPRASNLNRSPGPTAIALVQSCRTMIASDCLEDLCRSARSHLVPFLKMHAATPGRLVTRFSTPCLASMTCSSGAAHFLVRPRKGFFFTAGRQRVDAPMWAVMLLVQAMLGDGAFAVRFGGLRHRVAGFGYIGTRPQLYGAIALAKHRPKVGTREARA